jgi:hypothetical protein
LKPPHPRRHGDGLRWLLIIAIACGLVGACVLNPQPDIPGNNPASAGTSASGGTFAIGAGGEGPGYESGGKSGNPDVPMAGASEGGANGNGGESPVGGAGGEAGIAGAAGEGNGGAGGSP